MILIPDDPRIIAWVEERIGTRFVTPHTSMGFLHPDGRLASAFVFDNFTGPNINVSVAATPGGISRGVLRTVCRYVFDQNNCRRMTALVAHDNDASLKLTKRCGMTEEGRLKDYFEASDAVIMRMTREECKWL